MVVRGQIDEAEISCAPQLSGDESAIEVAVPAHAWHVVHAVDRRHDFTDDQSEAAVGSDGSTQQGRPMLVPVTWEQVLGQVVPLGWAKPHLYAGRHCVRIQSSTLATLWGAVCVENAPRVRRDTWRTGRGAGSPGHDSCVGWKPGPRAAPSILAKSGRMKNG